MTSGKVFDTRKGSKGHNTNKASDEKRHVKNRVAEKNSLWADGRKFLTVVVDEAHEFRNLTANFYSLLEVTKSAHVPLLLTATPLYTSPKVRFI